MVRFAWVVIGLMAWQALAVACTCFRGSAFPEASDAAPVVVHARVLQHSDRESGGMPLAMLIGVINPLRNAGAGEKLKVWGDNGILCRPYVMQFPVGTEWILALGTDPMFPPAPSSAGIRQFTIGGCGAYWLLVHEGKVIGELRQIGVRDEMPLEDFLRAYATGK